jgi:hypothetical protein
MSENEFVFPRGCAARSVSRFGIRPSRAFALVVVTITALLLAGAAFAPAAQATATERA